MNYPDTDLYIGGGVNVKNYIIVRHIKGAEASVVILKIEAYNNIKNANLLEYQHEKISSNEIYIY